MPKIAEFVKGYPLKRRALFALTTCAVLCVATMNWRLEAAKVIEIGAFTAACLFDLKGKWSMFFWGIAVGDTLLYLLR
jgi:hypothetical protein